jgi:probable dihydroxyacetone kinase regulator
MAEVTKRALAASLKKLLAQKPLDKITIIDIVSDCGVNRQTFYYHFKDIYDLLEWLFIDESSAALAGQKTYATWEQGFLKIFEWVLDNKLLITHVYRSTNHEMVEQYLYDATFKLVMGVVNEKAAGMPVRESDKKFIADFYKFAFVGLMLDWIRSGMKEDPKFIIDRLSVLVQGDIPRALGKYKLN